MTGRSGAACDNGVRWDVLSPLLSLVPDAGEPIQGAPASTLNHRQCSNSFVTDMIH